MKLCEAHGAISLVQLLVCLLTIQMSWPLAQAIVLPPGARISAAGLTWEHFAHMTELDAYLDRRWPSLIRAGYPFAILWAVSTLTLISPEVLDENSPVRGATGRPDGDPGSGVSAGVRGEVLPV